MPIFIETLKRGQNNINLNNTLVFLGELLKLIKNDFLVTLFSTLATCVEETLITKKA